MQAAFFISFYRLKLAIFTRSTRLAMSKLERRKFLKIGTFSTVAIVSPISFFSFENRTSISGFTVNKKSKVSAIKGDDLYSMTRDAIDALGGIHTFIAKGDKVFIKPNFVNFPWA